MLTAVFVENVSVFWIFKLPSLAAARGGSYGPIKNSLAGFQNVFPENRTSALALRATIQFNTTQAGIFLLRVRSDDGLTLYVDNNPVFLDRRRHAVRFWRKKKSQKYTSQPTCFLQPSNMLSAMTLNSGYHTMQLIFFGSGTTDLVHVHYCDGLTSSSCYLFPPGSFDILDPPLTPFAISTPCVLDRIASDVWVRTLRFFFKLFSLESNVDQPWSQHYVVWESYFSGCQSQWTCVHVQLVGIELCQFAAQ